MATSPREGQQGVSVPLFQPDEISHRRQLANWALEANQGHLKNVGNVTLNAGATTTTVVDARAGAASFIGLMATTANALSAGPTVYVSSQDKGSFILTHSNSAAVDKTFRYCILGG